MVGTPIAEHEIDEALVQRLLLEQFPDLAYLPIQFFASGWDNVMFRLGNSLTVRLPRRQTAVQLIEHEQLWLPQLAKSLPIAVPAAVRCGQPTAHSPWKWSILPWIEGTPASHAAIRGTEATLFAAFLRSLHVAAPHDAPFNPVRGVPLVERAETGKKRMERLKTQTELITPTLLQIWHKALDTPTNEAAKWLHGDLHPGNILVEEGRISGIIDWGDMTAGDPATDLAAIWMLFEDHKARQQALADYGGISKAMWLRSLGWAILFGVMLLETGMTDTPKFIAVGENTLRRVCEDAALMEATRV